MDRTRWNLATLTLANGISRFGDHFQILAVTSLTYALTGSPMAAALQMAVTSIPGVLFARWTGRLADRTDPRRLIGVVSLLRCLLTLAYIPTHSIPLILALNFIGSSVGTFSRPAGARLLPQLVGRSNLLKANARQSTVMGAVELVGPIIGGAFLVQMGPGWAFLVNALSYLAPALGMLLLRPLEPFTPARAAAASGDSPWTFLRTRPDLLTLLAANGAFQIGMWATNALFYPFVADVIHRGPDVLGWTISAYFGASLISGVLLERWGHRFRQGKALFAGFCFATLVWMAYTFAYSVPLLVILSVLDGVIYTLATVLFTTRVQEEAPPGAIGRIFAAANATDLGASVAGMLMGGFVATNLGILPGMRFSAAVSLLLLLPLPLLGARLKRRQLTLDGG